MDLGLTSTTFLLLFPFAITLYYCFPRGIRRYWLLAINLAFYASFGYQYVIVVIFETLVVWAIGIANIKFKYSVAVTLLVTLLLLFRMLPIIGGTIVAPLGLSFYTLQAISYVIDVKRDITIPERDFVKLLIYLSFFPTITSGPIYRYNDFAKEHDRNSNRPRPDYFEITNGIVYMIWGYFLKLVVAERASIPVNKVFDDFESAGYGGIVLFIIAITYSIQIYADFAGYSAIVIGIAQILGYKIPENFRAPYLAKSIKEFWSRWHISLSTWLRDYVYIPLGGNKKGRVRKYVNILITFVVSSLWHGFSWHFLIWGGIHGIYQIVGDMTIKTRKRFLPNIGINTESSFYAILQCILTDAFVTFAWIFFRTGVKGAVKYIIEMCTSINLGGMIGGNLWGLGLSPFGWILLGVCALIMLCGDMILYKKKLRIDSAIDTQGPFAKGMFVILISLMILILGVYGDQHDTSYFVYRDF